MKFTGLVALAGAAAAVTNSTQPQVVTTVVTAYTTYCPGPTVIRINANKTITVTAATTLTITACPCTITTTRIPTKTPVAPVNTSNPGGNPGGSKGGNKGNAGSSSSCGNNGGEGCTGDRCTKPTTKTPTGPGAPIKPTTKAPTTGLPAVSGAPVKPTTKAPTTGLPTVSGAGSLSPGVGALVLAVAAALAL